jgi:hypothetical protein
MVNLVTVPDIELMKVGKWDVSTGEFEVTPELITAAIDAHQSGVLRKPVIRLGHNDPRFSGDPAVGYIDNVRASEDGSTLLGDLVGMPEWLGEILPSAYPDRSIEGLYDYHAPDGSEHPFILTGLGLLGVTPPGVSSLKSMQDIQKLYATDALVDIAAAGHIGGTAVELKFQTKTEAAEASEVERGAVVALSEQLAEALGIDASADEETMLAKIAELKKPAPAPEPVAPQPEQVAAAAADLGLVMVNKEQYEATVAAAAAGAAARDQQIREADEGVVMAAIRDGRIPPARREHWLGALKADRDGTSQVLASLAKGLIPVAEAGHGIGSEDVPQIDSEMERVHNKVMARLGLPTQKVN